MPGHFQVGFQLLPRLKNLKRQKLYRPSKGEADKRVSEKPKLEGETSGQVKLLDSSGVEFPSRETKRPANFHY